MMKIIVSMPFLVHSEKCVVRNEGGDASSLEALQKYIILVMSDSWQVTNNKEGEIPLQ